MSIKEQLGQIISATPYRWTTRDLANLTGIEITRVYAKCRLLEKYGLIKSEMVPPVHKGTRGERVWYRVGRS